MNNNTFKSVTFGGFDKQDVIRYIEQTSKETAETQQKLQEENESLREKLSTVSSRMEEMEFQAERLQKERDRAQEERKRLEEALEQERSARKALEPAQPEVERLQAEVERLRPDAEAYARFREEIGGIECDARKRAADLEAASAAVLIQAVNSFQSQYQELVKSFDAVASHVTGELRKVEVNLTQLPRALDQTSVELKELSSKLERDRSSKGKKEKQE